MNGVLGTGSGYGKRLGGYGLDWIGQDRRWIGYDNGYGFVSHEEDEYDIVESALVARLLFATYSSYRFKFELALLLLCLAVLASLRWRFKEQPIDSAL